MCNAEDDVVAQVDHARYLVLRAEARTIRRWRHLEDSENRTLIPPSPYW